MAFANVEDATGKAEIIIFPRLFKRIEAWLSSYSVFIIKGSLDMHSDAQCKIKAQEMVPAEIFYIEWPTISHMVITLPSIIDQQKLEELAHVCKPGNTKLILRFNEHEKHLQLTTNKQVIIDESMINYIYKMGAQVKLTI